MTPFFYRYNADNVVIGDGVSWTLSLTVAVAVAVGVVGLMLRGEGGGDCLIWSSFRLHNLLSGLFAN